MSGYACGECGTEGPLFAAGSDSVSAWAETHNLPFLGKVPFDPVLSEAFDRGSNFMEELADRPGTKAFAELARRIRDEATK